MHSSTCDTTSCFCCLIHFIQKALWPQSGTWCHYQKRYVIKNYQTECLMQLSDIIFRSPKSWPIAIIWLVFCPPLFFNNFTFLTWKLQCQLLLFLYEAWYEKSKLWNLKFYFLGRHRWGHICKNCPIFNNLPLYSHTYVEKSRCMIITSMRAYIKIVKFMTPGSGFKALGWGKYDHRVKMYEIFKQALLPHKFEKK